MRKCECCGYDYSGRSCKRCREEHKRNHEEYTWWELHETSPEAEKKKSEKQNPRIIPALIPEI